MSTPSPTSDESTTTEGTVLRNFVDQAIAQQRLATMSPRSAVLSQSAFQSPVTDERSPDNINSALDSGRQLRKRSIESRRKRGNEVARPSALAQLMDVDFTRKDPRDEVMRLREMLKTVERHSVLEAKRASELERAKIEAERRAQRLAENQLSEKQETVKAQQEVRLFQLQLLNAQEEIERKQTELNRIEQQRDEAAADAKRERDRARKLYEQTIAAAAREEGRRLGFQAGFDYARQERRAIAARRSANPSNPDRTTRRRADTIESHSTSHGHGDKGKQRVADNVASPTNDSSHRRPPRALYQPPHSEPAVTEYYPVAPNVPSSVNEEPRRRPSSSQHEYEPPRPVVVQETRSATRPPQDAPRPRSSRSRHQPPPRPPSFEIVPAEAKSVLPSQLYDLMSPSQLPLKTLSPFEEPFSEQGHSSQAGPSHSTPLRPFVPSPESERDREERNPPDLRPPSTRPQSTIPHQMRTPAIQVYEIDIPSAEELNKEYSYSQDNSIDAIPQLPREQWLTASSYHELKGQAAPRTHPPPQPWPARPKPNPQQTPTKAVGFTNILSRPSLIKTKSQASSWYRSLSWRKKSKTVIDPIAEETDAPTSGGPRTGSTFDDSQPPTATEPPETGGSQEVYSESQPPASWYQANQPNHRSAPMSLRSGFSRMRPSSVASTRVSQFDILATPHAPTASVRDGRNQRENYSNGRPSGESTRPMGPGSSQPTLGHHQLQQQSSFGTLESSTQNKRRPRRAPPTIDVPNHDQELEPFGVAFNRGAIANGYQPYNVANLGRRPSRISEKTTPDTSIAIDVVPPSGIAPDVAQSPPHTGRNHLSPYHTYQAAAPSFRQSVPSQHTQGSPRPPSPSQDRPPSVAASRKPSKQSFNVYADPNQDRYQPIPGTSNAQPRPSSVASRPVSAMNNRSGYAESAQGRYQPSPSMNNAQPRPPSAASRPASVMNSNPYSNANGSPYQTRPESRISASKHPVHPPYASQTSLNNVNPNGGVLGQPKNASSSRLVLASPLHRVASNSSMRSQGSYSKYDPTAYVDPALWPLDGHPTRPAEVRQTEGYFNHGVPDAISSNSGLSYMSDPRNPS